MTYDQYLDLKNDYRAMLEELRKHNEHGASQQMPTATEGCHKLKDEIEFHVKRGMLKEYV